jgi:hypothetical protein
MFLMQNVPMCSAFRSVAVNHGLRGFQLRSGWIERHAGLSRRGPHCLAAGQRPEFQRLDSVRRRQRRVYGKRGGTGELELDGERSLGPSLGDARHHGNSHLHRNRRESGHRYRHGRNRHNAYRTRVTYLQLKTAGVSGPETRDVWMLLKSWSGRPGSNRRHPAWEAGVLPLNYSRALQFERIDSSTFPAAAIRIAPTGHVA